ncbi:hypothetical protein QR685DRAFT_528145 [Neurospora intermedia]|uniref:Uncharacterized protein n=1 Tax=Neurospora intermedia TaxID=5142 RepID=A0ABR3DCJ5_NEUIN
MPCHCEVGEPQYALSITYSLCLPVKGVCVVVVVPYSIDVMDRFLYFLYFFLSFFLSFSFFFFFIFF